MTWKPISEIGARSNDQRYFHLHCKRWDPVGDRFVYNIFHNCSYRSDAIYKAGYHDLYHDYNLWSGVPAGWRVLQFIEYPGIPTEKDS